MEHSAASSGTKDKPRSNDYYKTVIEPLLTPGCEEKLCDWLKKSGLLMKQVWCDNEECEKEPMIWSKARVIDRYNWMCGKCKRKLPIRHKSFFAELKCDFQSIFSTIDGWCSRKSLTDISENKSHKTAIGKRLYTMCASAAEMHMKHHPEFTILGGKTPEGEVAVVLVDIYPDGSMTLQPMNNNNYSKKVVCVADTSYIPARVWAQILVVNNEGQVDMKKVVELVLHHIKQNSIIVTSNILYPYLNSVPGFPEVFNIKNPLIYDPAEHQRCLKNIETIWSSTVDVCREIQSVSATAAEQLLWELQWRELYSSDPMRHILQHLVQYSNIHRTNSGSK